MKKVKLLFRYIIFFVIGNVIFNTVYSIIKVFTLNQIGGNEKYIPNWLFSFRETLLVYTILYLIFIIVNIAKKKITVNALNEKIKNMKK